MLQVDLKGSGFDLGAQHGAALAERIAQAIAFYRRVFGQPEDVILAAAAQYKEVIRRFNQDLYDEMRGIAKGAGVVEEWILAINCRSELMRQFSKESSECTAFYVNGYLCQTWDWAQDVSQLVVLMNVEKDDGLRFSMVTEPGMIDGPPDEMGGVPIHVFMRHVLESCSVGEALAALDEFGSGKSGNLIVADKTGCSNIEFAGSHWKVTRSDKQQGPHFHTNHYVDSDLTRLNDGLEVKLKSSRSRWAACAVIGANPSWQELDSYLSHENIFKQYVVDESLGKLGTISKIIMDVENNEIHVNWSEDSENTYTKLCVQPAAH